MIPWLLLLAAGFLAGAMNAVAGGGTFVALPALSLMGLPPTIANASTTVALFPGSLASAWAYRRDVRPLDAAPTWALLALSLAGGLIGALLLLVTPQSAFRVLIPWLLLIATATLAAGPRLTLALQRLNLHFGRRSILVAQLGLGVYGGYFGGAVGLMMLAVWSLATALDLRTLNPLRTLMVAAANSVAVLCFAATGNVSWRETLLAMIGGIAGGYLGALFGRRLPAPVLRAIILAIASITTVAFFAKAYLQHPP